MKKIVDPFVVSIDEDEQAKLVAAVDDATSGLMRTILRDSQFRKLEALWRGIYLMCRRVATSTHLKIFVADIAKRAFVEALKRDGNEVTEVLLRGSAENGSEPWAVVLAAFDFDLNVEDVAALMRCGATASVTSTPFVSHIRPAMLGIRSFAETPDCTNWDTKSDSAEGKLWTALRSSPNADSVGLIAPRLLGTAALW